MSYMRKCCNFQLIFLIQQPAVEHNRGSVVCCTYQWLGIKKSSMALRKSQEGTKRSTRGGHRCCLAGRKEAPKEGCQILRAYPEAAVTGRNGGIHLIIRCMGTNFKRSELLSELFDRCVAVHLLVF